MSFRRLTDRQREALANLLTRIASWSSARWDQHLRYDVGDEDADVIIAWLNENGVHPYRPRYAIRCICTHAPEEHTHESGCNIAGCGCEWRKP